MRHHRILAMYICRRTLAALLVLHMAIACGRAGSSGPPAHLTGLLTLAVSTTSLTEEPAEKT
jgi:hypothetical protein